MSAVAWIFSHVYADELPSAAHTPTALMSAVGSSSHTARPLASVVYGIGSTIAIIRRSLRSPTARAQASSVGTVPGSSPSIRSSILPASRLAASR